LARYWNICLVFESQQRMCPYCTIIYNVFNVNTVKKCYHHLFDSSKSDKSSMEHIELGENKYRIPASISIYRDEKIQRKVLTRSNTSRKSRSICSKIGATVNCYDFGVDLHFNWEQSLDRNEFSEINLFENGMFLVARLNNDDVSKEFLMEIDKLSGDVDKCSKFFDEWGTHYIHEARFGGTIKLICTGNQQNSHSGIDAGVKFAFSKLVDIEAAFKDQDSNQGESTNLEKTLCGGIQSGDYNEWIKSLRQQPAIIERSCILKSIVDLVPEEKKRFGFYSFVQLCKKT